MTTATAALEKLEANFDSELTRLERLARIPSVSGQAAHVADLQRCAEAVAELAREAGLHAVELCELDGVAPYVLGEWLGAGPDAPTVLFYAHYDVQPPGRAEYWGTPAFEPQLREDGRLYGRGVADDKAGIVLVLAALRAWFEAGAEVGGGQLSLPVNLPVNVKILFEGEEEIGSAHLEDFIAAQRERLAADLIVLADTTNLETGLPSLTTSLRGLVSVDIEVRSLAHPLHSGLWGGPLIDASMALAKLLARLMDDAGRIAVPGVLDDLPELPKAQIAELDGLPFDEDTFRADAGALVGVHLAEASEIGLDAKREVSVYEQLWRRPALAITALEGVPLSQAANQLSSVARAQINLRLAPGQDPSRAGTTLCAFLEADPPFGTEVRTVVTASAAGWSAEEAGPFFAAARRALEAGYARRPVAIGCGGTIPFVGPVSEILGFIPALLLGVEDPLCNAHSENESLHLGDFRKAARSCVLLLAELANSPHPPKG